MLNLNIKKKEALYKNSETELLSDFYFGSTSHEEFKFARIDSNFKLFLPYLKDGATIKKKIILVLMCCKMNLKSLLSKI